MRACTVPGISMVCVFTCCVLVVPQAEGANGHSAPHAQRLFTQKKSLPKSFKLPKEARPERTEGALINFSALKDSSLTLNLFGDEPVVAVRDRLVTRHKNTLVWMGHIEGRDSHVSLVARGKKVLTGTVIYDGKQYDISPVRRRIHRVSEIDPDKVPPPHDCVAVGVHDHDHGGARAISKDNAETPVERDGPAGLTTIDVMVVYTQGARSASGGVSGIESAIIGAVARSNQAYLNSQVDINLNLVHMAEVNYTETNDMSVTLSALRSTSDGQMDEVHGWRNTYGADLVALISTDTNYCGIGYLLGSSSQSSSGFSVTKQGSCLNAYTFPHELGHNMGCAHDRANAGSAGAYPYSYGYRYCQSGGYRTIMSYSCSGATRVGYFSNPNVSYNGLPTGIDYETDPANSADNARSLNNTKSWVSAFRASTTPTIPNPPTSLDAQEPLTGEVRLTWQDNADNETGFLIDRKENVGGTWGQIASLGSNASSFTDNTVAGGTTYFYRVSAWNSLGTSAFSNEAPLTTRLPNQEPTILSTPTAVPNPVVLPATTAVSVAASDPDDGPQELTYTWSQVSGPGSISFSPNGTVASDASTVSFSTNGDYILRVVVSDGEASVSSDLTVSVLPDPNFIAAPANLSGSVSGSNVTLTWSDRSGNEEGFAVERGVKSGKGKNVTYTFSVAGTVGSNVTSFTETVADGSHYYRVRAYNNSSGITSDYSNQIKVSVGGKGGKGGGGKPKR